MNNNYIGVDLDLFRQPKIQRLEVQLGKGAVALYIQLYLKLAECENKILEQDLPILEREFFVKKETLKKVIFDFDLFKIKDGIIYSTIIAEKLSAIKKLQNDKVRAGKLGAQKRWSNKGKNDTTNSSANSSAITDPLAENSNKRKENKNKVNKIKNKEIKKEKFDYYFYIHQLVDQGKIETDIADLIFDWLETRKSKNITQRVIDLNLKVLYGKTKQVQIQILENAIKSSWTGLFEPKQIQNYQTQNLNKPKNDQEYTEELRAELEQARIKRESDPNYNPDCPF